MKITGLPLTVLIADDSPFIRERVGALLAEVPGVTVVAETGQVAETLVALRRLAPAVVVLDLSMAGESGLEVLRQMRREQLQSVVIVLTNYPFPEYEREARRNGAAAFLNKSSEFMKVVDLVRDFSGGAALRTPAEADRDIC